MKQHPAQPSDRAELTARDPRCQRCDYPLSHLTDNRCPECGSPFDLSDPSTFNTPGSRLRNRTAEAALVMGVTVAVLAAWPPDMGELTYQLVIAGSILFALAGYYGTRNDPYWLTPGMFFVGFAIVCWTHNWRLSSRSGVPFHAGGLLVLAIVGIAGALALALMKAESHALRRKGKSH